MADDIIQKVDAALSKPKTRIEVARHVLRELMAISIWLYVAVKLFVFDVDVWAIRLIDPRLVWALDYKFPILVAAFTLALIFAKRKNLTLWLLYLGFYPIVVLFWKFPIFVWKQKSWLFAFALVNAGISFWRSFRRDFLRTAALFISTIVILSTNSTAALWASASVIFTVLTLIYFSAFLKAFRPSAIFQVYSKAFPAIRKSDFLKIDTSLKNLPVERLSPDQMVLRTKAIQNVVLYNRLCLFIAKRLRDYQRSRLNVVTYILGLVGLLTLTVLAFALINYAAFKIDPLLFQFSYARPAFFSFIYYSVGSMAYASNGLMPTAAASQAIQIAQVLFAVLLLVILAAVILSMRTERYTTDLNEVVDRLNSEGRAMEGALRTEFNLDSIAKAIDALQNTKADLVGLILFITKGLGDD